MLIQCQVSAPCSCGAEHGVLASCQVRWCGRITRNCRCVQALYCSADDPAGTYEGAPNVGDRLTLRQRLADVANGDNTLKR